MRRPEPGALLAVGLLLAGAALTGAVAVQQIGATDVADVSVPPSSTPGLQFLSNEQYSRRYAEGPAGAVTPPALLQANQRDSAYGSSLVLEVPAPVSPPGAPLLAAVAAVLLVTAALLRRGARFVLALAAGALGATTAVVGLTGGHADGLVLACLLVLAGAALRVRADLLFTRVHRDGGRMSA